MSIKALIGSADELLIERLLTSAGLVACDQQNRPALWVEGECHSPFAIRRTKSQLLHVRVPRAVQCIDTEPAQLRPELLEKSGQSENFRLDILMQAVEFWLELIANLDRPSHCISMHYTAYAVKCIDLALLPLGRIP